MKILQETVGPFAENSYILFDEESREAVAIDPGDDAPLLLDLIRRNDLRLKWILNTHGHLDHVAAVEDLREATGAPFHIHEAERRLLELIPAQAAMFGVPVPRIPTVDGTIADGQVFSFGRGSLEIVATATPGHSPGGTSFRVGDNVFVGDVIFRGSIGRTDLPGGSYEILLDAIREKLLVLPDTTVLYPGHGPVTTVGEERRSNPFLAHG